MHARARGWEALVMIIRLYAYFSRNLVSASEFSLHLQSSSLSDKVAVKSTACNRDYDRVAALLTRRNNRLSKLCSYLADLCTGSS